MAAVVAIVIGLLGITGGIGFAFYAAAHFAASLTLLAVMAFRPGQFIAQQTVPGFILSGIGDNVVLFIFAWTLAYAVVHVY